MCVEDALGGLDSREVDDEIGSGELVADLGQGSTR